MAANSARTSVSPAPIHLLVSDDAEIEKLQFTPDWVGKISYWIFHYRKPLLILGETGTGKELLSKPEVRAAYLEGGH